MIIDLNDGDSVLCFKYALHNTIHISGLSLGLHPANERQCYFVTMSLIGWVQA